MKPRSGFTLVELMVVILVIAILASILVPAAVTVVRNSRIASAKSEIAALETSIADFESEFGKQPPSFISFDPTNTADDARPGSFSETKALLRSMFPQISFAEVQKDLTAAGLWGKELHGPEALVFFLGGITRDSGGVPEMLGFSKNPARPFAMPGVDPTTGQTVSSSRTGPFFEFKNDRLISHENYLAYVDSLPGQSRPILYASTSATGSYRVTDNNVTYTYNGGSVAWRPYKLDHDSFINPNTFQLVSPGYDQNYGHGGWMEAGAWDPANGTQPPDWPAFVAAPDENDDDNLTNFSEGSIGD